MSKLKPRKPPVKPVAVVKKAKTLEKPPEPWSLRPGVWCSFYYEGGHGERYWSGGWHCGIVREIPIKGCHKNWVRIELMSDHYAVEEVNGERVRRIIPHEKPWVFSANINELGDTTYHGPKLDEIVAERVEKKAKDDAHAEQLKKGKVRKRGTTGHIQRDDTKTAIPKASKGGGKTRRP